MATIETIEEEVNRLATLLNSTQTGCLIFGLYNTVANRDDIMNKLKAKLKIPIHEFYISPDQKNPLELLQHIDSTNHLVVCFYDIEKAFPEALGYINYQREAFLEKNWGLVFWVTEYGRNEIANKAPDFWSRRSGVFDLRVKDYEQILIAQENIIAEPILYQSKDELVKKLNLYKELLEEYKTDKEPNKKQIADITGKIGQIYYLFADYTQSYQWLKEALSICEKINYLQGLASTYNNIGKIHRVWGNYQKALKWFEKSIKIKEKIGDLAGLAATYNNIGLIHKAQGNYQKALKWYEKSIKIKEKIGNLAGLAHTYNNIGLIHKAQGNYQEALKWYEKSIEIDKKTGNQAGLANTYNNIGLICGAQGNYQEALEWFEKSIKIKEKIGNLAGLAATYNNTASIHYSQGNYQEALEWYEKSKQILEKIGNKHHLTILLSNIALLYRDIHKKDIAKQYLQESYKLYIQLNLKSQAEAVKQLLETL